LGGFAASWVADNGVEMSAQRYIMFENEGLQAAFVEQLEGAGVRYMRDSNGAVTFGEDEADSVVDAAHRVRDAQFPWYFLKWPSESEAMRFRAILADAGLPFFVEQHESGTWFLVRRADGAKIDRLWPPVLDDA
jgi:hypothetical protein